MDRKDMCVFRLIGASLIVGHALNLISDDTVVRSDTARDVDSA